jgi:hypothetical protein
MLALPLSEPTFSGFASDEDPSTYSDKGRSLVAVDQLVDEAL